MGSQVDVYTRLAERYHLVGDDHFLELLEVLMTPEEGQYLLGFATPKTSAEIAETLNLAWIDARQLKARVMFSAEEYTPPNLLDIRRRDNPSFTAFIEKGEFTRYLTAPRMENQPKEFPFLGILVYHRNNINKEKGETNANTNRISKSNE